MRATWARRCCGRIRLNPLRRIGRAAETDTLSWAEMAALSGGDCNAIPCICGVGSHLTVMPDGEMYPCHALVNGAFRCGGIRAGGLKELCAAQGLLSRLAGLDFARLGAAERS